MDKQDTQDQPTPKKQGEKKNFFFPNVAKGLPFSCEAESREKAEEANKQYLKQQKDTQ
jgi:hypothetical protein